MGPRTWSMILKAIELAFETAVDFVKKKLKGGKDDAAGNPKA